MKPEYWNKITPTVNATDYGGAIKQTRVSMDDLSQV